MPSHAKLLLIGGGHAHVAVLADFIRRGLPCDDVVLLTPSEHLRYSGMVPGWIAGQYERDAGTVDVAALARRAGVNLLLSRCDAMDADAREVTTEAGETITFDIASIDTGGVGRAHSVLGDDPRILDVRPIDGFVDRLAAFEDAKRIAIIGGGAAGVELAFGLRNSKRFGGTPQVTLVTGKDGLLPSFSTSVRKRVLAHFIAQGIALIESDASIEAGELRAGVRSLEPIDAIIATLGSGAPEWPRAGGLQCDEAGFIATNGQLRSTSHENTFAVGDVASRQDAQVPHSGVHAVMAGPALAANLRRAEQGLPSREKYIPRPVSLYLLSTGTGSAILSYGPFAGQGRWVARLKHWIDNRWISQYAKLAKGS